VKTSINTSVSVGENPDKLQPRPSPVEIERKFLVANDAWRQSAVRSVSIRDGLIAVYQDRKVRVRISGDIATVAIKGPRIGIVRPEFEYEIPIADAERMLSAICRDDTLEKQRFFVENAGATWHVDVYGGILQGVVIAEIELQQETQELILPGWVGKEVTGDSFYKKINMRARALKAHRQGLSHEIRDHGGKADISQRNKKAKSEEEQPPLEADWQRDGSSFLWYSPEGEFVIEPAEIGGAAYFQLTYEGWTTLEQIGINDCDDPVDELKQRAQRHLARLVEEMRKASRAR
jgi:adenylate cyclase